MPASPTSTDIAAEQAFLDDARAQLARMRQRTLDLDIQTGDAIAAERLAITLWQRARSLEDDGRSALFFGRLDLDPEHPAAGGEPASLHLGRRHISDEAGDPVVVDWRAAVSTAYYRASRDEPMQVALRRRFGFDHGRISAIEDEHLTRARPDDTGGYSEILAEEIERPRVGPMRDIVSTIQPEQDALVRVDDRTTLCIQGAPGTGKTAVGLHRAAWLLYSFRERLARTGVLVVGPNRAFLDHIGAVLPALGEVDVRHTTLEDLLGAEADVRVRGVDEPAVAAIKGDARMAQVVRAAVSAQVNRPQDALVVPRGSRIWRVPAYDIADELDLLLARDLPYDAARDLLPQRLAHLVMLRMEAAGDFPAERTQDALAKSAPVRAYVKSVLPPLTAAGVWHSLLSDPEALAAAADGILSADEQRALSWAKPPRTPGSARWSAADAVVLDEIRGVLRRENGVGHLILDEAQDASAMQLRALGRRCEQGAATVLGDIAQGTTPWSAASWPEALTHLGKPEGSVVELTRGFRVPAKVLRYASRLLPSIAPDLRPPEPVRANEGVLDIRDCTDLMPQLLDVVRSFADEPGTVGVIVADSAADDVSAAFTAAGIDHGRLDAAHGDVEHRVDIVPATLAKGLEFDTVVVAEPSRIAAAEPDLRTGLRRLYVVLTRAVSRLVVLHAEPLPEELAG